jgi:hypothetical protein
MRRTSLAVACLAIAMACWAAPAQGQAPTSDSLTGTGEELFLPTLPVSWTFDVSSGPQGENPTGTIENQFLGTGSVTCLNVQGNRAAVGAFFPLTGPLLISMTDNGIFDFLGWEVPSAPITVCPPPGGIEERPVVSGNFTVVDAQPPPVPTSKDQCKNGGWRDYPQFKNQGQCIKFVNHGP